jgi:hypothetical protein
VSATERAVKGPYVCDRVRLAYLEPVENASVEATDAIAISSGARLANAVAAACPIAVYVVAAAAVVVVGVAVMGAQRYGAEARQEAVLYSVHERAAIGDPHPYQAAALPVCQPPHAQTHQRRHLGRRRCCSSSSSPSSSSSCSSCCCFPCCPCGYT